MSGPYIDVSSFQNPASIDYSKYVPWSKSGDGIARIALRVDQGTGTPDSAFAGHYSRAKAGGIAQFFFYHTCYPGLHPGWAGAQAEVTAFLGYLGSRAGHNDILMLDYEGTGGNLSGPPDWKYDWLHLCQEDANWPVGRVALYENLSAAQEDVSVPDLAQFGLILAAWNDNKNPPAAPKPWSKLFAWQYSDKGIVPGVGEQVDVNLFLLAPSVPTPPTTNQKIAAALDSIAAQVNSIRSLI